MKDTKNTKVVLTLRDSFTTADSQLEGQRREDYERQQEAIKPPIEYRDNK